MTQTTITIDTLADRQGQKDTRRPIQIMIVSDSLFVEGHKFPLMFNANDVRNHNGEYIKVLESLRRDVQQKGVDLTGYDRPYLTELRNLGSAAYGQLIPPAAGERIRELERMEGARGISLTFLAPEDLSPLWEMLYADDDPFALKPEQFWGFRYPLGCTYFERDAPDRIRLQSGAFSGIHHKLKFSLQEVQSLARGIAHLCKRLDVKATLELLDRAVPNDGVSAERVVKLFNDPEFRYGLVHFACHCDDPEDAGATRAYLRMSVHNKELELGLEMLLRARQKYQFLNHPLVFLNACGSATGLHAQRLTLPSGILGFGAGGVIATACSIPDNFASAFAAEFYRRLLDRSEYGTSAPIGEALLETRCHFLREKNNPLGLAYGLHAVSNQQLRLAD